jgi:hypothetical protein
MHALRWIHTIFEVQVPLCDRNKARRSGDKQGINEYSEKDCRPLCRHGITDHERTLPIQFLCFHTGGCAPAARSGQEGRDWNPSVSKVRAASKIQCEGGEPLQVKQRSVRRARRLTNSTSESNCTPNNALMKSSPHPTKTKYEPISSHDHTRTDESHPGNKTRNTSCVHWFMWKSRISYATCKSGSADKCCVDLSLTQPNRTTSWKTGWPREYPTPPGLVDRRIRRGPHTTQETQNGQRTCVNQDVPRLQYSNCMFFPR